MSKRMLIDASHPEETRVVVLDGNRVEEFDFESAAKRPLKGNIYLAKVTRVEPSLQAAFVEYGGNRQGFLAFSEIHPDYYQIPVADRMAILRAQTQRLMAEEEFDSVETATAPAQEPMPGVERAAEREESPLRTAPLAAEFESLESEDAESPDRQAEEAPPQEPQTEMSAMPEAPPPEAVAEEKGVAAAPEALAEGAIEPGETASVEPEPSPPGEMAGAEEPAPAAAGAPEETPPREDLAEAEPVAGRAAVQAEATGAPQAYQRRGPRERQNERAPDRPRLPRRRQYKIQEVIKRRQVMLVQVVKEERGNKGASLTTFLSLAGRYCVLMPNTPRGGGISRKITNASDRKRLKAAVQSLELPEGMGLIIRTAGANRTKLEIRRDYEYLLRLWDSVRELTLRSNAPALVYEEGSLIKRAIRDLYSKDISEIIVDGEAGYREAKDFMRMLMPSHAKNVKLYKEALPLFQKYQVESQLDAMFSPVVNLKSGGYIVINQTEALVAIDVNSGKATREHSIEETATKTNLEAADEIARQLRLRDLAGLIVIDFIDMEDPKNDRLVEKRLQNAVKSDRARVQIGKISQFGLLEMSRQRLRAGVLASSTITCPHCNGQGIIRSTESAALRLLRALDEEGQRQSSANLTVKAPLDVTIYTLNQKRREIARIEEAYDLAISFDPQPDMMGGSFEIERTGLRAPSARPRALPVSVEAGFHEGEPPEPETDVTIVEAPVEAAPPERGVEGERANGGERGRKRRRRRRGGRGRPSQGPQEAEARSAASPESQSGEAYLEPFTSDNTAEEEAPMPAGGEDLVEEPLSADEGGSLAPAEGGEKRRRRRRRGRRARHREEEPAQAGAAAPPAAESAEAAVAIPLGPTEGQAEVQPNAPSTPLWSLADHPAPKPEADADTVTETRASPHPPMPEPAPEEAPAVASAASTETADLLPLGAGEQAVQEPPPAMAPPEGSRETRRGWWQRRFKL